MVDEIVQLVLDLYEKLPRKGKPTKDKKEWTVLSAFVQIQGCKKQVVALGTGTKCLGQGEVSFKGDLVHDSHAEVIAKRSFVSYLMDQLLKCQNKQEDDGIFEPLKNGTFRLKDNIHFYFYTSFPPCGDATIAPKIEIQEPENKRLKLETEDIYRTGAKSFLDKQEPLADYHVVGAVRTKPGRGDPTLSLSCSDKIAKWCHVGFQGTFLASLLSQAILPKVIIVGDPQANLDSLQRAFFSRFDFQPNVEISKTKLVFADGCHDAALISCDSSIFWNVHGLHGVIVEGRKQGCVKKHWGTSRAQSPLCRLNLARKFLQITEGQETNYQKLKTDCLQKSHFDYEKRLNEMKAKLNKKQKQSEKNDFLVC